MRRFRGLANLYHESNNRRALSKAARPSSTRLTRQGALQLELLESRCMLASGNFLRLDGIPPSSIPTSDDLSVAQATEAHAHSYDRPNNVLIVDDDPAPFGGPFWTVERDEILAWSGGISDASVPNAYANATAQALSQVVTDIGNTVAAPTVSLVAAQLGLATGSDDSEFDVDVGSKGDARSESILYTRFQYQAPPGEESLPFLFKGFIHAAAGGVVSSEGNGSAGMGTLITPPLLIDPPPGPPLDINGIRIWLEGGPPILLAEVYFKGWGDSHEGSPPATTGEWTIWGSIRDLEGQYQSFFQTGSGAQALIPFDAEIAHGSVIVFDADPNRTPAGLFSDIGGVGGYASVGEAEEAYQEDRAQANVFQVINAWGFADNNSDPPPDEDDPIFDNGGGGPGDLNGDGENDGMDAGAWAQILADYAARGLTPLIVTTEDDIANGNYSFGDLSLREAITLAASANYSGPDTIVFAPWVEEIDLVGTQLTIANGNNISIIGPGADELTIDGQNGNRVFSISAGASVTLRGLHITRGAAGTSRGGGIASTGTLTVDQCLIDFSSAANGGGIYRNGGALVVSNSTIANNSSTYGGGVFLQSTASAMIVNSTISTNTATEGGGVYSVSAAAATLLNSTVTNNSAVTSGGGIYSNGMVLHNSIVAGNAAPANPDINGSFATSSSYNLIGNDANPSNGINNDATNQVGESGAINAMLGSLQDNGGAMPTHALLAGSPAIDKGDPNFDPNAFSPPRVYDQRGGGFARIIDGDAIVGARVDIGAYEYQPPLSASSAEALDAGFADYGWTQQDWRALAALAIDEETPQKRRPLRMSVL